jgi:hypothetical protein
MQVNKLEEHGYESAVYGFSLSYNTSIERTKKILPKYAFGIPGESKFLESIILWVEVNTSRALWSEMDTYRISTKQSESTMHTLGKRPLVMEDFEYPLPEGMLEIVNNQIILYKEKKIKKHQLKNSLPEGFLQKRVWCFSYKTLQNIVNQRKDHIMPQWNEFIDQLISQIDHPEFIIKPLTES